MPERLYGPGEVAEACGISTAAISMRVARGAIPKPDYQLRMGPVWRAATIRPWIRRYRRGARR